jgi:hypothetical protein
MRARLCEVPPEVVFLIFEEVVCAGDVSIVRLGQSCRRLEDVVNRWLVQVWMLKLVSSDSTLTSQLASYLVHRPSGGVW